jgi:hypothetical protein
LGSGAVPGAPEAPAAGVGVGEPEAVERLRSACPVGGAMGWPG